MWPRPRLHEASASGPKQDHSPHEIRVSGFTGALLIVRRCVGGRSTISRVGAGVGGRRHGRFLRSALWRAGWVNHRSMPPTRRIGIGIAGPRLPPGLDRADSRLHVAVPDGWRQRGHMGPAGRRRRCLEALASEPCIWPRRRGGQFHATLPSSAAKRPTSAAVICWPDKGAGYRRRALVLQRLRPGALLR